MVRNTYGKAKPDEEIKRMLHGAAVAYSKVCDKQVLFIHRKNSEDADYHYYETYYGKENFIHLVGCCSNKYVTAVEFYEKCLDSYEIPTECIEYKESKAAATSKLDIFEPLFDFKHVKIYKIGRHDKMNEKNNFQMGLGNVSCNGVLGYTKYNGLPVPTTFRVNQLSEYSSSAENVLATLCKKSEKYDTVIGSVKSGLKVEDLPKSIQDKIYFPNGIII